MNAANTTNTGSRATMRNAVTGVLSVVLLAGCTMGEKAAPSNVSAAEAKAMLADGRTNAAIDAAEAAVLGAPRNAGYRAMLGNAYLRAGRFEAAATTYDDARRLGDQSARTALSLALARIGAGKGDAALNVLAAERADIAPADLGLAVALAGDPRGGISILSDALRNGANTAKVRQNLAYSYALAGMWREARVMAAEDVPADQLGDRMAQWASTARPEMYRNRVAALIDAPVVADPGQPQRLALANFPDAAQFAAATESGTPVSLAAADPVGVEATPLAPAAAPRTKASVAPVAVAAAPTQRAVAPRARYVSNPVVQAIPSRLASSAVAVANEPASRAASSALDNATHLIQLGSFSSRARAEKAWDIYLARNPELKGFERLITPANVRGKTYYRVQAAGFDRASAKAMCGSMARSGEGCLALADRRGPQAVSRTQRARR